MFVPVSLLTALLAQGFSQLVKAIIQTIKDRRISLSALTSSGGMPSAHSAFVTALVTAVGIRSGFTSDVFAVGAVFAAIVIHDAYRVRGTVGQLSQAVNEIRQKSGIEGKRIEESIGHTFPEIIAGVFTGAIFGSLITFLFMSLGW